MFKAKNEIADQTGSGRRLPSRSHSSAPIMMLGV
jgi:hypothetical protein